MADLSRLSVRAAREDDFEAVAALYGQFASGESVPIASGADGLAQWRAVVNHPGTTVFAAELEDDIVGLATLHVLPNMTWGGRPYALIENVITAGNCRGKGVGRKVMQRAIDAAEAANAYKVMLLTGKGRKDGGVVGFYEKLGFTADEKYGMTIRRVPVRRHN